MQLVGLKGIAKGTVWPLGEEGCRMGRDPACAVYIPDLAVSRQQCEIYSQAGAFHLRDLGGRNTTLLNGIPIQDAPLNLGDRIAIGGCALLLTEKEAGAESRSDTIAAANTIEVRSSDAIYLKGKPDELAQENAIRTVHDLHRLFVLGRSLGAADSVAAVRDVTKNLLIESYPGCSAYVVSAQELDGAPSDGLDGDHWDLLRHALKEHKAVLSGDGPPTETSPQAQFLAAPVTVQEVSLGAIGVFGTENKFDGSDLEFLLAAAQAIAPHWKIIRDNESLGSQLAMIRSRLAESPKLVGRSPAIGALREAITRTARTALPVLILGETGTGKELVATSLHEESERLGKPYLSVNCAAIPAELFASEIFGHVKGAFSGADRNKTGLFEMADGGTLFLDEVGDLDLKNQAMLLRALEYGVFRRVGDTAERSANVRILSATNRDLEERIRDGRFREDLYHRLNGVEIAVPPLRKRIPDIRPIAEHFLMLESAGRAVGPFTLEEEAFQKLEAHAWPGNVRELRHVITRACSFARDNALDAKAIQISRQSIAAGDEPLSMVEMEREHIRLVLEYYEGNVRKAAVKLGIGRTTLYGKIRDFGLGD